MGRSILVVDDSATVRQQVNMFLTSQGFSVTEACDGADGLAKAKAARPDLIIADVNMPIMNGIEMIAALRKVPGLTTTPIFVLTTASGDRVAEGKKVGATAWIIKPFKPDTLLMGIKKALGI